MGLGNQNKSQHILHARNMVLGWEREKGNCYTVNTSPVSAPDLPWPHPCLGKPIGIAGNQTAICIKGVGMGAGRGKRKKTFLVQRQIGFLWYWVEKNRHYYWLPKSNFQDFPTLRLFQLKNTVLGRPSRWQSKTWRSPSSLQIHQKYICMWNNSYRTPTECWQKTSDFPKGCARRGDLEHRLNKLQRRVWAVVMSADPRDGHETLRLLLPPPRSLCASTGHSPHLLSREPVQPTTVRVP